MPSVQRPAMHRQACVTEWQDACSRHAEEVKWIKCPHQCAVGSDSYPGPCSWRLWRAGTAAGSGWGTGAEPGWRCETFPWNEWIIPSLHNNNAGKGVTKKKRSLGSFLTAMQSWRSVISYLISWNHNLADFITISPVTIVGTAWRPNAALFDKQWLIKNYSVQDTTTNHSETYTFTQKHSLTESSKQNLCLFV